MRLSRNSDKEIFLSFILRMLFLFSLTSIVKRSTEVIWEYILCMLMQIEKNINYILNEIA